MIYQQLSLIKDESATARKNLLEQNRKRLIREMKEKKTFIFVVKSGKAKEDFASMNGT
jgi:hypothetical protein